MVSAERKEFLYNKVFELFQTYNKFMVLNINNITSKQLQQFKKETRSEGELLIAKNTIVRKVLSELVAKDKNAAYDRISDEAVGNIAFFFTNSGVSGPKKIAERITRSTRARPGAVAQADLFVEPMVTALGAEKAAFFQALGVAYKVTKSKLEILGRTQMLTEGTKVGIAQANFLSLLNIEPFVYALRVATIFENGCFYEPWIADLTEQDAIKAFGDVVEGVAALSMATGEVNRASVPYLMRNVVADSLALMEIFKKE